MFKRKLKALDYVEWDKVNGNNTQHFRKVIVWLEDQKIRYYKIEDRKQLRDINSPEWSKAFEKYCNDLNCPIISKNEADLLEWFIGYTIWLEFGDDCQKYQQVIGNKAKITKEISIPSVKSANPLDNLDFDSNSFKNGVNSIAKLLKIPRHSDHLATLEACSKLICNKLSSDEINQSNNAVIVKNKLTAMTIESNFNMGDVVLDKAAKGLSLLYIQDLRNLQTKINETIVAVQNITANPKTDTKLGKVGK